MGVEHTGVSAGLRKLALLLPAHKGIKAVNTGYSSSLVCRKPYGRLIKANPCYAVELLWQTRLEGSERGALTVIALRLWFRLAVHATSKLTTQGLQI